MWAAAEGHSDVVQLLIARGADVKAASKSGFTALVFAAIKNDAEIRRALLAAGADPNYALRDGITALNVAASYKSSKAAARPGRWRRRSRMSPTAPATRRCIPRRRRATSSS